MTKQTMKFGVGALALVLLGFGALYVIRSYIPEYQARKAYEKLIEEYKNDPYGGETPEETLALFIDALKKGDVELAAKYFDWGHADKLKEELNEYHDKNYIDELLDNLIKMKLTKINDNQEAYFTHVLESGDTIDLILIKQNITGKWKIIDL